MPDRVELPNQALDHMSEQALAQLPAHIAPNEGDPGVFLTASDPAAIYGDGWYHYGTSADQTFVGHPGILDVYLRDFGLNSLTDVALSQGNDTIDTFDAGLDQLFSTNSQFVQDSNNYTVIVSRDVQQAPNGLLYPTSFYQDTVIDGYNTVTVVPGQTFIEQFVIA